MKYNSLYKDFFDNREFVQKYEFTKSKKGDSIIIVTFGSNEKCMLEDSEENRLLLKEYDEKIKRQLNLIILNRSKINNFSKIKFLKLKVLFFCASFLLLIVSSFNLMLYINDFMLYLYLVLGFGVLSLVSLSSLVIPYLKSQIIDSVKIMQIDDDIQKNLIFMRNEKLLYKSLNYNKGAILGQISYKNRQLIDEIYQKETLGIGAIDSLSLDEMTSIETQIFKLKEETEPDLSDLNYVQNKKTKNLVYKKKSK